MISMTGITAFAAEDTNETIRAVATENDATVEAGNVNVTSTRGEETKAARGVIANSRNENTATVTTKDVTAADEESVYSEGVYAQAFNKATSTVTVDGDVTATSKGSDATGIAAQAYVDSSTTVNVKGDVTVEGEYADGIYAGAYSSASTEVTVDGNLTATATTTEEEERSNSTAVFVDTASDSNVKVAVKGDLKTNNGAGIAIQTYKEREEDSYGTADIVVGGVLSAKDIAVNFYNPEAAKNTSLTVWKVDLSKEGNIAKCHIDTYNEDFSEKLSSEDLDMTDFEKTIRYIIKLEQPTEGGILSVNGTESYAGYDTAKEGETVLLKVNVKDGYRLVAAYNGKDQKLALKQDASGNYYIVVPKGGGVYLSAVLEKIEDTTSDNADKGTIEKTNQAEKKTTVKQASAKKASAEKANDGLTKVTAPQTGDAGQAAWVIVLAASLAGLVVVRRNPGRKTI